MSHCFEQPVSASADVAELEYCSALRQTDGEALRLNGSLTVRDVQLHLQSRHGVWVDASEIEAQILVQLGGYLQYQAPEAPENDRLRSSGLRESSLTTENEDGYMRHCTPLDLVQQTALVMIPQLLQMRQENAVEGDDEEQGKETNDNSCEENENGETESSNVGVSTILGLKVVESVLLLLCEEAGVEYGADLDEATLRRLLSVVGDDHWPDSVVESMLEQARSPESVPLLDAETFLTALTSDVKLYDLKWEQSASTHFEDVNSGGVESDGEMVDKETPLVKRGCTAPWIDFTADTLASFWWPVVLWWSLFGILFAYIVLTTRDGLQGVDCANGRLTVFGCKIVNSIIYWLQIAVQLIVLGFAFIFLNSMGNSVYLLSKQSRWLGIGSTIGALGFTFLTVVLSYFYETRNIFFNTEKDDTLEILYMVVLVLGCIVLYLQATHVLRLVLPNRDYRCPGCVFSRSMLQLERDTKQAASFKVQRLITRAMACHSFKDTGATDFRASSSVNHKRILRLGVEGRLSSTLNHYNEREHLTEPTGGVFWALRRSIFSAELACTEGIWLWPRLYWCNLAQWSGLIVICVIWLIGYYLLLDLPDPVLEGMSKSGLRMAIGLGGASAVLADLAIAIVFIPSTVATILRFRCGNLGSLRDNSRHGFQNLRQAQDTSSQLYGLFFFGAVVTSVICWAVVTLIVLAFVFEMTRPYALTVVAQLVGIFTTILIKMLVLMALRSLSIEAFYRKSPLTNNIVNVVMEAWNLALSTGYVLSRTTKLILVAVFYIGRMDTPILADGVGTMLDRYPSSFRKDVVSHDAHRHPYMERWACLYLLKLRYGDAFGTAAGAAWRILFTLGLMPWLRKYRIQPSVKQSSLKDSSAMKSGQAFDELYCSQQRLDEALEALNAERQRRVELEKQLEGVLAEERVRQEGAVFEQDSSADEGVLAESQQV